MEEKPYHVQEVQIQKYFCDTCQQWHAEIPAFKVFISTFSFPFWTCSRDDAQKRCDLHNLGHERMKNLSIAQGHEPVLI